MIVRRLAANVVRRLPSVSWWTELGFSFHRELSTLAHYSGSAVVPDDGSGLVYARRHPEGFSEENSQGRWMPLVPILRVASDFTVGLYVGLPMHAMHCDASDERGTSPVKLTNHFPQVKPPTTLTLDRQLTVSAADRRTFEGRSAVLHHFVEAGTSSRPKRDSSPGLVPWLLRYHCLR